MHRAELESWTNENGNFVLIGDSCHLMLPYLVQGAKSSIEDGGVLGRLLGSVESKLQLPQAVRAIVKSAERDHCSRDIPPEECIPHARWTTAKRTGRDICVSTWKGSDMQIPSRWTCAEVQPWLYGCDAYKEADVTLEARPFTLRKKSGQPVIRTATNFVVEISSAQIEELGLQPVPLVLVNGNSPDETTRLRALWTLARIPNSKPCIYSIFALDGISLRCLNIKELKGRGREHWIEWEYERLVGLEWNGTLNGCTSSRF